MLKQLTTRYTFHVFFWIIYLVFTLLETKGYIIRKGWAFELVPISIFMTFMGLLMFINNRILIPRFLEKRKLWLYITGLAFCIVWYTYLRSLNQRYWDSVVWPDEPMNLRDYFLWNFLYAIWFLIISSLLYFTQKWTDHRQREKNIQISELQAELKYLRSQLNPHFLFNGLNTIYGNIDISNQGARNILLQFADLLRYHLYEADVEQIELGKEAVYIENYVALQKARSDLSLKVDLVINIEDPGLKIAPLIFIAFIENAFKFSTRDALTTNFVRIILTQVKNEIRFNCENSFENVPASEKGIGLSNVRRRLELIYKDRYQLEIDSEKGYFSVHLKIYL